MYQKGDEKRYSSCLAVPQQLEDAGCVLLSKINMQNALKPVIPLHRSFVDPSCCRIEFLRRPLFNLLQPHHRHHHQNEYARQESMVLRNVPPESPPVIAASTGQYASACIAFGWPVKSGWCILASWEDGPSGTYLTGGSLAVAALPYLCPLKILQPVQKYQ